jgi:hypothetical protein
MHELWSTILAPLLEAARPALTIDVGGADERLVKLTTGFVESWDGRLQSWRWQAGGELPSGEAELVLVHEQVELGRQGELLNTVAIACEAAGRPLPLILVHGVEADGERLAVVRRFAAARAATETLVLPGLGGVAIVLESPLVGDAYGRLNALIGELRLSRTASGYLAAVERSRLAERARAEEARAQLAAAHEHLCEHELLLAERDELRARVRELADVLATARTSISL